MAVSCYHCGGDLTRNLVQDDRHFCCNGCVTVYKLLLSNNLGNFYELERSAGKKPKELPDHKYLFLDQDEIRRKYISYEDGKTARVKLYLPDIHCSSCIYLLENIHRLNPAIQHVTVNFTRKEAQFSFNPAQLSLSGLAFLLDTIGYEPNFGNRKEENRKVRKVFLYKLGVAGFAFGSIMLWSFPEYLGLERDNPGFRNFTSYLSLAVSVPVLLYSAQDYFRSAFSSLKLKKLNLDVPITIGIIALYLQSLWSILTMQGPGYMDSFAGFIFFLLIGKWFQGVSYQSLSFERDYTSYFPVAVTRTEGGQEQIVEIEKLRENDRILIHNSEIIPCDSVLLSEQAEIDFSFVTGESGLVPKKKGDFIYAGGKLIGRQVELEVRHVTSRSHLTSLWNELKSEKEGVPSASFQDRVSVYFLAIVLTIAGAAALAWYFIDPSQMTRIAVSVLIVTCPCALALSSPFTLGNIMRLLGRRGLYLKNTQVIERLNQTTDIVFDKTGTLTAAGQEIHVAPESTDFSKYVPALLAAVSSSLHPVSKGIKRYLLENFRQSSATLKSYFETPGAGVEALVEMESGEEVHVKIGSAVFAGAEQGANYEVNAYISFNGKFAARAYFTSLFRPGIEDLLKALPAYRLHVLTGDHLKDKKRLEELFPKGSSFFFEQSPADKLNYIRFLQSSGKKVLMIGDGLNDAGALKVADTGIAVSEDSFHFTPSSDAIIAAGNLVDLPYLLKTSRLSQGVLWTCLAFSVAYNLLGLSFAVSGQLSPLVAAILMPISSVTVVFISTFLVMWLGKKSK